MSVEERLKLSLNNNNINYKEIKKLIGDASTRVYYRIFLNENTLNSENSIIAMVLPEKIEVNEKGNNSFIKEEPFLNIQRYLKQSNLNIPSVLLNDENNRVILNEDLSDKTVFVMLNNDKPNYENVYKSIIDELIKFQDYTQKNINTDYYCFKREFDYDTLKWELDHFIEWNAIKGMNIQFTEAEMKIIEETFKEIALKLTNSKKIVVHRDFQSKNIMFKNNKYYLIDFQDALLGSEVYDLVALLKDSYVELNEDFVQNILKYYIKKTKEIRNIEFDFDEFYKLFKLQTIQRKLKDTGRFHFINLVRKNPSFLQYLPLSKQYVSLYLKELYPELFKIIEKSLRDF